MKIPFSSGHASSAMHSTKFRQGAIALAIAALLPTTSQAQESANPTLEEVVVTGSYLSRFRQSDLPSPTSVLDADYLDDIGAANVADVVQNLTINSGSQNNPDAFTQNGTVGSSNFNLRGLGVASTLVLQNGRRQVGTGALTNDGINFVDTNSLVPQIAVKRIEIVKDGAAAIYGTDAVAGVVNFITDNDFRGSAVNVRLAGVDGEGSQSDVTAEVKFGWGNDNTDVVVAASYFDRSPLTTAERRLSRPQDDSSSLGNPGSFFLTGLAGGAVPVIDPTGCESQGGIAAPIGAAQPLLDAAGIPFRAGLCQFDFGDFFNLVPEEERINLFGTVTHQFGGHELRVEAAYTDYEAIRGNSPSFPFLQTGSAIVPANNPGNIFPAALGTPIFFGRVSGNGGSVSPSIAESETLRLSAELSGAFLGSENWNYDIAATYGTNEHILQTDDTVTSRFQDALFGFGGPNCDAAAGVPGQNGCLFFNPFATSFGPIPNDPALVDFLIETQTITADSDLLVLDAVFSGTVGSTAAGDIGLAVGAQYRREDFARDFDDLSNQDAFAFIIGSSDFDDDRDIVALFSEIAIPLSPTLDFNAALRYEDYGGNIGDTIDPKVSFLYRPTDALSFRASYSTSFRAPSLFQVNGQSTSLQQVNDPLGGTAFAAIRSFAPGAGGRDISPEESQALNLGASFSLTENLDISIDYWNFEFDDAIIQTNQQAIVDADPTGPQVIRGPGGNILFVFNDFVNASTIETDGIDLRVDYNFDTSIGVFSPFLDLTRVFNYDIIDPQAGFIDGAGNRNFSNFGSPTPETRFNLGINYATESVTARLAYRSVSSFSDDQNEGQRIDSFDTLDAQVNFLFGSQRNINATIGVTNLTDELPPQVFTNGGFESRTHDPRGRIFYAQVGVEF